MEGRGAYEEGSLRSFLLAPGIHEIVSVAPRGHMVPGVLTVWPDFLPALCLVWTFNLVFNYLCPGTFPNTFSFQSQFVLLALAQFFVGGLAPGREHEHQGSSS